MHPQNNGLGKPSLEKKIMEKFFKGQGGGNSISCLYFLYLQNSVKKQQKIGGFHKTPTGGGVTIS